MRFVVDFVLGEAGAASMEYGLVAGLISLAVIAGLGQAGQELDAIYSSVDSDVEAVLN